MNYLLSFGDAKKSRQLTVEFYRFKYHDYRGWMVLRGSKTWIIQMLVSSSYILLYWERENRKRRILKVEGIVLFTFYRKTNKILFSTFNKCTFVIGSQRLEFLIPHHGHKMSFFPYLGTILQQGRRAKYNISICILEQCNI